MTAKRTESRVTPHRLKAFASAILRAVDVPPDDAELTADTLVDAERRGNPSHGMLRLPWYVARIQSGAVHATTAITTVSDSGSVAIFDGRDGIGQVIAVRCMQEAMAKARIHGVGVIAVRNSNHFGTAAYFTRMAATNGCIGVLLTTSSPAMAPWGGRLKAIGGNPWSVAAPAGRYGEFVLDIANTAVARGKIYVALQQGVPIPIGWALDSDGRPTTDPSAALAGALLPTGGHKGYAVSFAIDILAGILTGSSFAPNIVGPYSPRGRSGVGHLFIAFNIENFMPINDFNARVEKLIQSMKDVPLADGFEEILFPGELEERNMRKGRGIVLPAKTRSELASLAADLSVPLAF